MPKPLALSLFLLGLIAGSARAEIIWHWEDRFSEAEQAKLTRWIADTVDGIEQLVAPYPFDIHIAFHRSERSNTPVPWAHTVRSRRQGVNFHVDPGRSLDELRADWTAPHELSHLLIPWVGRNNAWFAEGFASYMQYKVLHGMGILDAREVQERYRSRIRRAEKRYDLHDVPFAEAATRLAARREYPTMYWGGAVYFARIDQHLQTRGGSLLEVLSRFVACCRVKSEGFEDLVAQLDRLAGKPLFREHLAAIRTRHGFPDATGLWDDVPGDRAPGG